MDRVVPPVYSRLTGVSRGYYYCDWTNSRTSTTLVSFHGLKPTKYLATTTSLIVNFWLDPFSKFVNVYVNLLNYSYPYQYRLISHCPANILNNIRLNYLLTKKHTQQLDFTPNDNCTIWPDVRRARGQKPKYPKGVWYVWGQIGLHVNSEMLI